MKKNKLPVIIIGIVTYFLIGVLIIGIIKYSPVNNKVNTYTSTEGTFSVETSDINIEPGEKQTITIKNDSNENLTWSSEDETIARVDGENNIIGVRPGTTKIIIQKTDTDFVAIDVKIVEYGSKEKSKSIIPGNPNTPTPTKKPSSNKKISVEGIKINKTETQLIKGNKETLITEITPSNATNQKVTWTSSNSNIVSVSNGVIIGKGKGTATITVTTEDGKKKATCKVTVIEDKSVKTITLSKSSVNLGTGSNPSVKITASFTPADAINKTLTWSSSNNNVATVSNGVIKGIHEGNATITASSSNGIKATVNVNVTSTDRIHFIPTKLNSYDTASKGDAIVLESNGYFAMIDTGDETEKSRKQVLSYLNKLGINQNGYPLEFVLITHLHGDHYGCFNVLLKHNIKVNKLYIKRYSESLGKKYATTYTSIMNCAKGINTACLPVNQILLTQNIDNSACPESSNQANSNFNCTSSFTFQKMNIKLYNTGYVMKDGDIGSNGKKYKSKKKSDGVEETYNANYESIYEYIKVNNHRIVLAADAVGEKPGVTLDSQHPFTSDRWYQKIKSDAGTNIDILKAPHHGDMNGDKNYSEFKPKNVVVTNANRQIITRSGLTDYEKMGSRIIYVDYYDNTADLAGVYADLSTPTVTWHRMKVY